MLVTLNRHDEIDPACVLAEFEYDHPVFDAAAMAAQRRRDEIQGRRGMFFAGAYWGYGFHEDGVQSALEVVRLLESAPMTALRAPRPNASTSVHEPTFRATIRPSRSTRGRCGTAGSRHVARVRTELFLAYLDVDALPGSLDRAAAVVGAPPGAGALPARDFLDGTDRPLGDAVRDLVEAGSGAGRRAVHLLAHLRTFGWLFNPLSVYYCWTPDGGRSTRSCSRSRTRRGASGTGTCSTRQRNVTTTTTAKAMHVSPFLPMDVDYRVTWTVPGAELQPAHRGRTRPHAGLRRRARIAPDDPQPPARRHHAGALPAAAAARLGRDLCASRAPLRARVPVYRHPSRRAGKEQPMTPHERTRASRSSRCRATPQRLTGGTVRLVDPSRTRASATTPPRRLGSAST